MKKAKKIVSFILCLVIFSAMSITAFADGGSGISPCCDRDNDYGLYATQRIRMSHGDVVVRSYAGIPPLPQDNRVDTLYYGDWITVLVPNYLFTNDHWWTAISADKGCSGFSASEFLY